MRTDTAQPIRLKDYRPPDWLVETVSLDVSLHPTATKVRATIALKPNPASNRCTAGAGRRRPVAWCRSSSTEPRCPPTAMSRRRTA